MSRYDQAALKAGRRASRFGCLILIAVVAVFLLFGSVGPYTEYLWFREDARHPEIFTILYQTKGLLFIFGFVVALGVILFSLSRALKLSTVYVDRPTTPGEVIAARVLGIVQEHGTIITKSASVLLAFFAAAAFSNEWNTFLLWSHAQPFHRVDPIFGQDLSFFAFTLPWLRAMTDFLFSLLVLVSILTGAVYVGLQSVATVARIELGRPAVRSHLAFLIGSTILLFGVHLWLGRYEFGLADSGQFVGAGYAASQKLSIQSFMAVLMCLLGLAGMSTALWRPNIVLVTRALVGVAILYVLGMLVYPGLIQTFMVTPNKLNLESKYASRAIASTRFSYGLDKITAKQQAVLPSPTAQDVSLSKGTLDNMRLWDPDLVKQSAEALQGFKQYYRFNDVDIDRYTIGGRQQMVMLAARDVDASSLSLNSQGWVNMRLQYTHGFGIVMSPVNETDAGGQPKFIIRDIPPVTPPDIPIKQPRIYFSDYRTAQGASTDNYVLLDTKQSEFDYPSESNNQVFHWTGDRGVNTGAIFQRLAFAIALGDTNLLISPNITGSTRILLHRNVLDRAQLIYPFLTFDNDPYIVAIDGRLVWILDGYTTSDLIPYSAHTSLGEQTVNYVRNPVKVTIDAYTGETNAYAIDPDEPVLRTYEQIYPTLIKNVSELPAGLRAHFRYPEDMFHAQAVQLTQYHVSDAEPVVFLNNEDAWDMPTERGLSGAEEQMRPYYVQMRLPEDAADQFLLILPFTPRQKGNMSGWLAAHCDPGEYGKIQLYEYPKGSILSGPKQMEAQFNQNPAIANLNTLLRNANSQVIPGNLLVVPIGNSLMYVEPMFLESASPGITAIPQLKKVILAFQDRVVVADTYAEALQSLLGGVVAAPAPAQANTVPSPSKPAAPAARVSASDAAEALKIANDADAALRAGDFAKYGELQKQLKQKLQQMAR